MKRNKEEKLEKKHRYDKGQIFVKVMAGFLALLMVIGTVFTIVAILMLGGTAISLVYALIF